MPRDMFGDVVNPSIKIGSKKWYTVPLSILVHVVIIGAIIIVPADGGRRAADAAGDDGVRCGAAAAATTATAAAAAGPGRGAQARHGREPGRRARPGALADQA